jgi:hypothetical protein
LGDCAEIEVPSVGGRELQSKWGLSMESERINSLSCSRVVTFEYAVVPVFFANENRKTPLEKMALGQIRSASTISKSRESRSFRHPRP